MKVETDLHLGDRLPKWAVERYLRICPHLSAQLEQVESGVEWNAIVADIEIGKLRCLACAGAKKKILRWL